LRYYFLVAEGAAVIDDENGTDLADDNAARQHAVQIIAELKADFQLPRQQCPNDRYAGRPGDL
jgi:hypothetical protein